MENNIRVIFGQIRFYEESDEQEKRAVVDNITGVVDFKTTEAAEAFAEEAVNIGEHDSYLIPRLYDGEIEYNGSDFQTLVNTFLYF